MLDLLEFGLVLIGAASGLGQSKTSFYSGGRGWVQFDVQASHISLPVSRLYEVFSGTVSIEAQARGCVHQCRLMRFL